MKSVSIQKSTLTFLKNLSKNNNRDWFTSHKEDYLSAQKNMIGFIDQLILEMNHHDQIETESGKKSLFRIYNDVRFSKDKTPYRASFSFYLRRATKLKRGGYYMIIKPGGSYLSCGFFGPNPDDLKRIRQDISYNYDDWNKIINQKKMKENFGKMVGDTVLTAPRGFQKDHPAIELLRHKQFFFRHSFSDKEILDDSLLKNVNQIFKSIRPWFDYMSDVLTTDSNGELIV